MIRVDLAGARYRLYFKHYRNYGEDGKVSPKGEVTYAYLASVEDYATVAAGTSVCSREDRFEKEYGRRTALERLLVEVEPALEMAVIKAYVERPRHSMDRDVLVSVLDFSMLDPFGIGVRATVSVGMPLYGGPIVVIREVRNRCGYKVDLSHKQQLVVRAMAIAVAYGTPHEQKPR